MNTYFTQFIRALAQADKMARNIWHPPSHDTGAARQHRDRLRRII